MELIIQQWNVDEVKPYELNAKIHDKAQVERIAQSIKEFGWDQPIVVDKEGVIIKGHGRREAALLLGLKVVPVLVRSDLDEHQVRAARLADNRVAIGDIDTDLLQKELQTLNFDLEGIFDKKELNFVVADLSGMNVDSIVLDLDSEIAKQTEETIKKIEETDARAVRIDKALGFKEIKGEDERFVAQFMAVAEGETGLEGADAFIEYIKNQVAQ
ncbi:ParB N-terminal domain-containing protein [Acinetobacter baumannii]|nr:ParB N-terminal domain-containing protein [Acinetobacter baumannii]MBP4540618.1 ParB N-terminal domain-containing protein [Acinetobacter baumannii]